MSKILLIVIAIIVVIGGGYMMWGRGGSQEIVATTTPQSTLEISMTPEVSQTPSATATPKASSSATPRVSTTKTFTVTGQNYSFAPSEIRVKKGDTVHVVFKNAGGMHDWVLDEFGARTFRIQAGQTAEVTFVANNTGTFEYYCSVGSHRAMGMKGMLIVQ